MISALVSGSETAFFSLRPADLHNLSDKKNKAHQQIKSLLDKPKELLAAILIANNFVNVGIIILSAFIIDQSFDFSTFPVLGFIIKVVAVTFVLLLFGEIMPKIYANQNSVKFVMSISAPMFYINKFLSPLSNALAKSTAIIDNRVAKKGHLISLSQLGEAIDISTDEHTTEEEKNILKGIAKFADIEASEIMKVRMDIVAVEINTPFLKLIEIISESGFSRIPVYEESMDKIKGVIYIKDLLPHLNNSNDFSWSPLLRAPFYVPENKRINDLLDEFRQKKIHLAIVVDEYGGTSGIITLEDVLEEIVGEISDEFDVFDDDIDFEKINDNTYLFAAKTSIIDFCKILKIDDTTIHEVEGDFDSIAGLFLELYGNIPKKGTKVVLQNLVFTVESLDNRRIKKLKVEISNDAL
ncbi:MAG: gliding motility-associated protein GldE [Bacteroidales bacterium]|nr:gliding motility-associated protein GldE [Bacteroidales bacterium]